MADGIKIAKERIAFFEAEIGRLKDFIRQSEKLFSEGWLGPAERAAIAEQPVKPSGHASLEQELRRTAGSDSAADDDDDELALTCAENAAATGMGNGVAADRKGLFRRAAG